MPLPLTACVGSEIDIKAIVLNSSSMLWTKQSGAGELKATTSTTSTMTYIPSTSDQGQTINFDLEINGYANCPSIKQPYSMTIAAVADLNMGQNLITCINNQVTVSDVSANDLDPLTIKWSVQNGQGTLLNTTGYTPTYKARSK